MGCSASLRTRVALLVGVLVFVLAMPLLILLPARVDSLSKRWVDGRLIRIARLGSAEATSALMSGDRAAARVLLARIGSTCGAVRGALLLPDGSPLARWNWNGSPGASIACRSGLELVVREGGVAVVCVPMRARAELAGTLALAFDGTELQTQPRQTAMWLATGAGFALLIGIVAAYLIGTVVARPLWQTTEVAERIAGGDFTASNDLQTWRQDEAGALARAFECMLGRLYEHQLALARKNVLLGDQLAELRRTQEQLVVADRRISVGRLAAGVAHEVNNPLAYVRANLDFVASSLSSISHDRGGGAERGARDLVAQVEQAIGDACHGTDRIRQIVQGLKSFSHSDDDRRERLRLSVPLEAAIAMAAGEIKQRARLVRCYQDAPEVEASEVRLSQVFLNLLINAGQAIPPGASDRHTVTVTIRTSADGCAVVEVQDTGCGIPHEIREKLFQAFFTTKPAGAGTGLGLSISQGIVHALGGRIEVESTVGRGSTFRVVLPPAPPTPVVAEAPTGRPMKGEAKSLLVVDDEPLVGNALERALGSEFRVVAEASAASALARLAIDRFHLVLCDLAMPDMSGPEFHAELRRSFPEVAERVIFMTGGAFSPAIERFASTWPGALLEKPVDMERLRKLIAGA